MDIQNIITIVSIIIGSGIIQFFVTRRDTKAKEAKEDKLEALREELQASIKQREQAGNEHFEIHKEAIASISKDYQENFGKLLDAIEQLKDNNKEVSDMLNKIADGQETFSSGLLGLTHFELMYITDIVKKRKYITLNEKATIKSIYEPYKKLGGNGLVSEAVTHVMNFPVISDNEALEMDEDLNAQSVASHSK